MCISVFPPRKGETAESLPCTREVFEMNINSHNVANIYSAARKLMESVTEETPEEFFKEVKEKVNKLKVKLPVIMPGAHSLTGIRKASSPEDYVLSPFATLDIDRVWDPMSIWKEKIFPNVERLKINMVYITPSTIGLKVIFTRPVNMTPEEAMKWMAGELGIAEYDTSVKDPLRAHFIPCPESLLFYQPEVLFDTEHSNQGYMIDGFGDAHQVNIKYDATVEPAASPINSESSCGSIGSDASNDVDNLITTGYYGIPYEEIVQTYIEVIWGGKEPIQGDRNVKTLELANQMRYICDNNVAVLDRIIPCFCQFSPAEKLSVIQSATKYELKLMPKNLREVLFVVKRRHTEQPEIVKALDEVEDQQLRHHAEQLIECFESKKVKLPASILASFDGVNPNLWMVVLIGICPFIGGLATGVWLKIHDDYSHLNIFAFIVGEAASGKSKLDALYNLWLYNLIAQYDINFEILEEYRALPQKKKESTPQPVVQMRIQPLRCSMADVLARLKSAPGKHLLSFGCEADQLTQSQKSGAFANVGVLLRQSYDGSHFDSGYVGSSAVNANVKEVLWNLTMCTTPDGLRRAMNNVTDGSLTRIAIAVTPDNTYAPLVRIPSRTAASEERIMRVATLLELVSGKVELPKLEQASIDWLEKERLESLKDDNKARARQRMRVAVTAMRVVCCMMLCAYVEWLDKQFARKVKVSPKWMHNAKTAEDYLRNHPDAVTKDMLRFQTPEFLESYNIIADYLKENILYYFGNKISKAYEQDDYAGDFVPKRQGKNASIFDSLSKQFSIDDARKAKSTKDNNCSENSVNKMLQHWVENHLCKRIGSGLYEKL